MNETSAAYSHVAIVVTDIDVSQAFYTAVFGFRPARGRFLGEGPDLALIMGVERPRIEGLFMTCDGFVIELLRYVDDDTPPAPTPPTRPGYRHLSFIVADVAATMDAALANGGSARAESRVAIEMGSGAPVVFGFVADPDGNSIELIGHPDASAERDHAAFLRTDSIGWPPSPPDAG